MVPKVYTLSRSYVDVLGYLIFPLILCPNCALGLYCLSEDSKALCISYLLIVHVFYILLYTGWLFHFFLVVILLYTKTTISMFIKPSFVHSRWNKVIKCVYGWKTDITPSNKRSNVYLDQSSRSYIVKLSYIYIEIMFLFVMLYLHKYFVNVSAL